MNTNQSTCPSCGGASTVTWGSKLERFPYGTGDAVVVLEAVVPVGQCCACHFVFTDHRAETIKDETVTAYVAKCAEERKWKPIATAPRDGTVIQVRSKDGATAARMRWSKTSMNLQIRENISGIWEAESGQLTWSEHRGFGPDEWAPIDT